MSRGRRAFAIFLVGGLATGCTSSVPNGLSESAGPDQFLDYNQFVCAAQPVLIRNCSFLACHGDAHHAFRLYSLGKLRLGDAATRVERSTELLSVDEVEANFASTSGLLYATTASDRQTGDLDRVLLLGQAMAARFGGSEHKGVAMFPEWPAATPAEDAGWLALKAWVAGARQPSPPEPGCAALFQQMQLQAR